MKMNVPALSSILLTIGAVFGVQGAVIDPASLGLLSWLVSDPSIASVRFDSERKAYLVPTGKPGTVIVTVSGDQDPSTPQTFSGQLEVTFADAEAAVVDIVGAIVDAASVTLAPEDIAETTEQPA